MKSERSRRKRYDKEKSRLIGEIAKMVAITISGLKTQKAAREGGFFYVYNKNLLFHWLLE